MGQTGDVLSTGRFSEDHLKLKQKDIHAFWPDGMVRISGREFNGLIATPCFAHDDPSKQMTCLSCHEMHQPLDDPRSREEWANDQLKYTMDSNRPGLHTNQACTQCHSEYEDENKILYYMGESDVRLTSRPMAEVCRVPISLDTRKNCSESH